MRIACCLFGQPRRFREGHQHLSDFFSSQNSVKVDYFYHCWTVPENTNYTSSPWRSISLETLKYQDTIEKDLELLYSPVARAYEVQRDTFNDIDYKDTLAYKQTVQFPKKIANLYNTFSQAYSRTRVRDLFESYVQEHTIQYDLVVMTRFDVQEIVKFPLSLQLTSLDPQKVHMLGVNGASKKFHDPILFMGQSTFLNWLRLYRLLPAAFASIRVHLKMKEYGELLHINAEETLMSIYLYLYKNLDNIQYIKVQQ